MSTREALPDADTDEGRAFYEDLMDASGVYADDVDEDIDDDTLWTTESDDLNFGHGDVEQFTEILDNRDGEPRIVPHTPTREQYYAAFDA